MKTPISFIMELPAALMPNGILQNQSEKRVTY
jgi:hypothetical protein